MSLNVEFGPRKRGVGLRTGDVMNIHVGSTRYLRAKVLDKSVMFGFAALVTVYEPLFETSKARSSETSEGFETMICPLLVDSDVVRSGLMQKVGKSPVSDAEIESQRLLSPIAEGDHPLAAYFDAASGSYYLNDRLREPDYIVNWQGEKASHIPGSKFGLWGVVPNADRVAEMIESVLAARPMP